MNLSPAPRSTSSGLYLRSAFGTGLGAAPRRIVDHARLSIVEEPFLSITSLRRSRLQQAESLQLAIPLADRPNGFIGDAVQASARFEPNAWLLIGKAPMPLPTAQAGWLITDLSARLAAFRIEGADAGAVLAASTAAVPGIGGFLRTLFAESYAVLIQCLGEQEFRLLVDVSFADACADWLADAVPG